jgi:UDP-2-acetamido-2-deoxy-ribo-hexuluronate aminotransferase
MRAFLTEKQIGTEIYYPRPLHQQPCFAHLWPSPPSLPWAETFAAESLALPIFPELRAEEIDDVCDQLTAFFSAA